MLWIMNDRGICAYLEYKWNDGGNVHKYLMVTNEDEGARLFLAIPSDTQNQDTSQEPMGAN